MTAAGVVALAVDRQGIFTILKLAARQGGGVRTLDFRPFPRLHPIPYNPQGLSLDTWDRRQPRSAARFAGV